MSEVWGLYADCIFFLYSSYIRLIFILYSFYGIHSIYRAWRMEVFSSAGGTDSVAVVSDCTSFPFRGMVARCL